MALKTISLDGIEYIRADSIPTTTKLSNRVIVRCTGAGVHVGTLVKKEGDTVILENANRLFYFKSATPRKAMFSLSEVATQGLCRKQSKIGALVSTISLRDWHEIIPVTEGVDLSAVNND